MGATYHFIAGATHVPIMGVGATHRLPHVFNGFMGAIASWAPS